MKKAEAKVSSRKAAVRRPICRFVTRHFRNLAWAWGMTMIVWCRFAMDCLTESRPKGTPDLGNRDQPTLPGHCMSWIGDVKYPTQYGKSTCEWGRSSVKKVNSPRRGSRL